MQTRSRAARRNALENQNEVVEEVAANSPQKRGGKKRAAKATEEEAVAVKQPKRPTEKSLPKPKMAGAQGLTLDTAWESLHEGLNAIYIGQRLSVKEYMGYYSKVHDFCANTQQQQNVRHRVPGHTRGSGSNSKGAEFAGRELYDKLKQYLQEHVEKIQDEMIAKDTEDELLIHYAMTWNKYAFSSKVVDGLFRYLNRHWIKREKDEGNKYVHDVYNLCLMLWKQVIFSKETSEGVTKAAIQLIARDRNGEKIQDELIKNVVDSLEQLGHEEETIVFSQGQIGRPSNKENPGFTEEQKKNLRVYLENFEEELLNVTDVYYSEEADQYLAHHSIVDYMIKVETRLQEEEGRVRRYLHLYSMVRVAESLENVFIANKLTELQSEFGKLLQQDRDADLTRLFKLCSRVDGALDRLRQEFLSFVTEKGKQAVAILETNDVGEVEARAYVGAILAIHQRYNGMVKDAFSGEAGFVSSFDRACNVFINNNVVTQKCAKVNKSAELLARYSDMILRKGGLKPGDDDVEVLITNTLTIFKYVDDKDIFQKFYTKMLAKRLTSDTSANQDAEGSMITKLKAMCGFEYTNKMQRMFTDVGLSQSLNEGFQNSSKKLACDFSTMVLGSGAWPLVQSFTCSIPKTLETCIESFRSFYTAQHQGRKLTWLLNMSRGELQTNGFNRKYTLITTTAQMAVLLMYNDTLTNTYGLLRKELDMQKEILLAVLQSFVKAGLIKLPEGTKISGALPEETQVTLNMKFTFKKMKIDLVRLQQAKFEAKQDAEQMEKNIEADRQLVIQAAIVRIMKMRKQCNHTNLITEIITQISTRFNPKIGMVKKCIDILMEKEYIKRSDKEKDMYEYIS